MTTITRELHQSLLSGDVTSTDLVRQSLDRITALDGRVKAFLRTDADSAIAQAATIDAQR